MSPSRMEKAAFGQGCNRFRYIADVKKGRLPSPTNSGTAEAERLPYLAMDYLRGESEEPNAVPVEPGLLLAEEGDILLLWDGSNAGEFLRAKRGIVSSTTALVTPKFIDHDFLFWACKGIEEQVRSETVGMGIPHVNGEVLANITVYTPSEKRQRTISTYLNNEVTRLDELTAAKGNWLELLAEKRCALIAQAVLRGIDPSVPLRDSGIPWLGDIPTHWEIERTRWLFRERDQRSETGMEELLTVSHLTGVTPRSEKNVNMFEAESTEGYKVCYAGDLVINTLWAWMGAMGTSRVDGIVSPAYHVYTPGPLLDPSYVDALVRIPVFAQEAIRYSKGVWSSRLRLYPEGFFEITLPVPPLEEQKAIVEHITTQTSNIDRLCIATERSIALLKERRAALIAAAVTGQIDPEVA